MTTEIREALLNLTEARAAELVEACRAIADAQGKRAWFTFGHLELEDLEELHRRLPGAALSVDLRPNPQDGHRYAHLELELEDGFRIDAQALAEGS